jgi:hypothetical protein
MAYELRSYEQTIELIGISYAFCKYNGQRITGLRHHLISLNFAYNVDKETIKADLDKCVAKHLKGLTDFENSA